MTSNNITTPNNVLSTHSIQMSTNIKLMITEQVILFAAKKQAIAAIKFYRKATGQSLRNSKDFVDAYRCVFYDGLQEALGIGELLVMDARRDVVDYCNKYNVEINCIE